MCYFIVWLIYIVYIHILYTSDLKGHGELERYQQNENDFNAFLEKWFLDVTLWREELNGLTQESEVKYRAAIALLICLLITSTSIGKKLPKRYKKQKVSLIHCIRPHKKKRQNRLFSACLRGADKRVSVVEMTYSPCALGSLFRILQ